MQWYSWFSSTRTRELFQSGLNEWRDRFKQGGIYAESPLRAGMEDQTAERPHLVPVNIFCVSFATLNDVGALLVFSEMQ